MRSRLVFFGVCALGLSGLILSKPVWAQRLNPQVVADEVYRQIPDLPKESQHRRKKGNEPTQSSLISRVIQYHTLVKGREPQYRFDWKITLADYLGLHDSMREETYPGRVFLKTNPLESDRKSIQQLTRQQRLALVQILSDIYVGQARPQEAATPAETPKPEASPAAGSGAESREPQSSDAADEPSPPQLTPLPGSGGADLLRGPAPQSIPSPSTPSESTTPPATQQPPTEDSQQLSF